MDEIAVIGFMISIISAFISAGIFSSKSRSVVGGFFLGLTLGIVGIIVDPGIWTLKVAEIKS